MKITSDLHVHTNLSSCAKPEAEVESYLKICRETGIKTIAFTNHFWDGTVPGASGWYRPQDLEHVLKLREQLPADSDGVRILFGCETEYVGGGKVAITPDTAKSFDWVLIPPDHFHMKGFTLPASVTDPAEVREYLIRYFMDVAAIELGVPTGIAHPFMPLGSPDREAVIAGITDAQYRECFTFARERGKSIELNSGVLKPGTGEYVRMMTAANECGCSFHIGSDAHTPSLPTFQSHAAFGEFAEACGIKREKLLFEGFEPF